MSTFIYKQTHAFPQVSEINQALGLTDDGFRRQAILSLDADGVLTEPVKKIVNLELVSRLRRYLERGEVIAINSGRPLSWLMERVVAPLVGTLHDKNALSNLLILGEKGATWAEFDPEDGFIVFMDTDCCVPAEFRQVAADLLRSIQPSVLRWDAEKRVMVSFEFEARAEKDPYSEFEIFKNQVQPQATALLKELIAKHGLGENFRVDSTQIAIDIEHVTAGKAKGTGQLLNWLMRRGIQPSHIVTVGDSTSDFEMAEFMEQRGVSVTHVHVGDKNDFAGVRDNNIELHFTGDRFDRGTVELFDSLNRLMITPETNGELLSKFSRFSRLVEVTAPFYDRVFLSVQRIEFNHDSHQVRIYLDSGASPVRLSGFEPRSSLPDISWVSALHLTDRVTLNRSASGLVESVEGHGLPILISSGTILLCRTESGELEMIVLRRTNDAPVAPGEMQSCAGRCDKFPGASAFQESAEEHLLVVNDGEYLLGLHSGELLDDNKIRNTIKDARENALKELHKRRGALIRSGTKGAEVETIGRDIQMLEDIERIVVTEAKPATAADLGMALYQVTTLVDGVIREVIDNMFVIYQPDTNTLEMRLVLSPSLKEHRITALFDGDGFGRTVEFRTLTGLNRTTEVIHWPTLQFIRALERGGRL